ncbi:hypothetical protein ASD38_20630 [Caulobacter sp. Root487D2Y]|nr:hypothetical protein ASD38_20630 [Caulobacter sp. Root487D2Y]
MLTLLIIDASLLQGLAARTAWNVLVAYVPALLSTSWEERFSPLSLALAASIALLGGGAMGLMLGLKHVKAQRDAFRGR